jgi:hypothetical protein
MRGGGGFGRPSLTSIGSDRYRRLSVVGGGSIRGHGGGASGAAAASALASAMGSTLGPSRLAGGGALDPMNKAIRYV